MQTTVPNVKQLPIIPKQGELYLSINLALADPGQVWQLAKQLGFIPELAYLPTTVGIEIHALLLQEKSQLSSLLDANEYDARIESLLEAGINSDAIRFVYGRGHQ
ncbi:MAG: hypothetical protein JOZ78_23715 [Chroococcidiopsidaceae cyanobacterium CP_BM_ER_R8_30]|nr:hypothetical protein [Chroococcidiopsidaceae cyanobacterium CP_BM_ER_R8_30]